MRTTLRAVWLPLLLFLISAILAFWLLPKGLILGTFFILTAIFFALDLIGRYSDYQYLKKSKYKKKLYWELFSKTRCSREVMIAADPRAKSYYKLNGYKWYHLLPDNPRDCFTYSFLASLHKRHKIPK